MAKMYVPNNILKIIQVLVTTVTTYEGDNRGKK